MLRPGDTFVLSWISQAAICGSSNDLLIHFPVHVKIKIFDRDTSSGHAALRLIVMGGVESDNDYNDRCYYISISVIEKEKTCFCKGHLGYKSL